MECSVDISHRGKSFILERLPRMYRQFIEHQLLDISASPMEVAPTAHYSMGGLVVDPETHATDVVGLFAAGECASGLHGANRLGGNSRTETIVYGRRAGTATAALAAHSDVALRPRRVIKAVDDELDGLVRSGQELARAAQRELRDLLWECCGVMRTGTGLAAGLERLAGVRDAMGDIDVRPSAEGWGDLAQFLDLQAGVALAGATLGGAQARTESRGCHNRADFPELDRALERNLRTCLTAGGDGLSVEPMNAQPVPPVPADLVPWLDRPWDADLDGRWLE